MFYQMLIFQTILGLIPRINSILIFQGLIFFEEYQFIKTLLTINNPEMQKLFKEQ
jgi:hypothetical protein